MHTQSAGFLDPSDLDAQRLQQLRHEPRVGEIGHVFEHQRLGREQRRRLQLQRRILGPVDRNDTVERRAARDLNAIHERLSSAFRPPKWVISGVMGSDTGVSKASARRLARSSTLFFVRRLRRGFPALDVALQGLRETLFAGNLLFGGRFSLHRTNRPGENSPLGWRWGTS